MIKFQQDLLEISLIWLSNSILDKMVLSPFFFFLNCNWFNELIGIGDEFQCPLNNMFPEPF